MKFKTLLLLSVMGIFGVLPLRAQSDTVTSHQVRVIREMKTLQQEIKADPDLKMVDLLQEIPSLVLDLRYTTTHDFMHRALYPPLTTTYIRRNAAQRLKKVQAALQTMNLGLKIFDAYRPWSVTVAMWQPVKDDRYAADPSMGSGHNRGIAVDLTIIDLKTRVSLPMGTGFDNFTDSAHRDFIRLPAQVLANRLLLQTLMEENGFISLRTEWWHFSLPDPQRYEVLDLPFSEIQKEAAN